MPPADDEGLLAAVSTAVEEARPADVRADDAAVPDDPAPSAPEPEPTPDPGQSAAPAPAGDGTQPTDPDPNADRGDGRNAHGRFVKKQGETDQAFEQRKAAAPAAPADPVAPPKKLDHVNDPIPEGLKGKTRERIEYLTSSVKSVTAERDTARQQLDTFTQAIRETNAPPEVFARHVEVLRLMNSADPAEQAQAVKFLRAAADNLAGAIGEDVPGKNPLEGHQDLIDDVEDGDLSRERAIEIARARNKEKAAGDRNGRATQQTEAKRVYEAQAETARVELNALGIELARQDPTGFGWKTALIKPEAIRLKNSIPPTQWVAWYKQKYASYEGLAPRAAAPSVGDGGRQRVPAGTGQRQPMRPRQGAGGAPFAEPKSLAEAVEFGIANANRR